ncbi:uncharacterized protein LOC143832981 [Paroedura picta]|uniref:uncharacterized protein LOC143832981 n=1 Tax=Paroedura picta TaxID=143630 RepID=UPI0040577CF4
MILSSRLFVLSLCCTAGWAAPILYKQDQASEAKSDQSLRYVPAGLEQRIVLWLLSVMGFYGLAWLFDDFPMEPCTTWQGAEDMDCKTSPAQMSSLPRNGCSVRSTLKSLGQMELNLVTLLYKLRKQKEALVSGWPPDDDQDSDTAEDDLSKDLVIYTIEDEA